MINKAQHGFLHGRSCVTQLLSTPHHIGQLPDRNTQTDVLFLDFAKAFDSVDHGIPSKKLKAYGISGNPHNRPTDYLRGRTQRVVAEGAAPEWSPVTSGVPQGSILGPMLFLLFINDPPDAIPPTTPTGLYADDTKPHTAITSRQDRDNPQEALSYVDDRSKESNTNFNTSKCKALTISRRKQPIAPNYHLGSAEPIRVDSEVDLGITVTSNLSWNRHTTKLVTKANPTLGPLRRTRPMSTNCDARRTLYLSLVKSQLSYATETRPPYQSVNKISLEKPQRRATRRILQVKKGDIIYKDRLPTLNLLPLTYDREIKDLTFFFKLLHGYYDLNVSDYVSFVSHCRTRNRENPPLMLKVPSCKTSTPQPSFSNRIVPLWNCVRKAASPADLRSPITPKPPLSRTYLHLTTTISDADMTCTWSPHRTCSCHRNQPEQNICVLLVFHPLCSFTSLRKNPK